MYNKQLQPRVFVDEESEEAPSHLAQQQGHGVADGADASRADSPTAAKAEGASGPNGEASEGRAGEQQTVEEGERRVSSTTHDSTACRFKGEEVDSSVASSNGTDA